MMRQVFLFLVLCLKFSLFSGTFHDEDTGFFMDIPAEMQHSWNLSNYENGMEFNVFQTKDHSEQFSVIVTAKIPMKKEEVEEMYSTLEPLKYSFGEFCNGMDVNLEIETLPSLVEETYVSQRYRVHLREEENLISLDVHTFLMETHLYVVVTTTYPCEKEQELEVFTKKVLQKVQFPKE